MCIKALSENVLVYVKSIKAAMWPVGDELGDLECLGQGMCRRVSRADGTGPSVNRKIFYFVI